MAPRLRVAMAQVNVTVGDVDANARRIARAFAEARANRADLVTLPELALTGYPPEDLLFRRSFIDANLKALRALAPLAKGVSAVVGFVDRDGGGLYNAAAFLSRGRVERVYRKRELPNYGVFDEERYFTRGDRSEIVDVMGVRVALTICEDIWETGGAAYTELAGRAELIVNISASPFHAGKQKLREALVAKLARRTRAAVVYQNLVGGQDELVFDGGSVAAAPSGVLLARAGRFREDLRFVDFGSRTAARPGRPPGREEEVYDALVLGTRDYVRKNGFTKALIGLSGGIDSALVSCVAADALGPENVLGVTMPSPFTSEGTLRDALRAAAKLGVRCLSIGIEPLMRGYESALRGEFGTLPPGLAEENLQARIRGNILMALSNKFGHVVLATGNKSEMATGYCTLYGDMCGGFAPIKDVPKTLVFALARHRNRRSPRNVIPETVLRRAPTAELRHGQKDRDSLPPYPVLDRFLREYVERNASLAETVRRGVPRPVALKLAKMVRASEYKRRQAPPGVKITPRAFGRDRRMPITSRGEL